MSCPRISLLLAFLLTSAAAFAHHSSVMFDRAKEVTLKATVKQFYFVNPHVSITVTVPDDKGAPTDWAFEAASVEGMVRSGWKKHTVKPGDSITIIGHPLRNGEHGAQLLRVILADGTSLPPQRPGEAPAVTDSSK
jgi:hypothetical protein